MRGHHPRRSGWLVAHSDPDIELQSIGVAAEPVRYTGLDGIREWFGDIAKIWRSIEFQPEEIRDLCDRVFVVVR